MSCQAMAPTTSGIAQGRMNNVRQAEVKRMPGRSITTATAMPTTAWSPTARTIHRSEKARYVAVELKPIPDALLRPLSSVRADVADLLGPRAEVEVERGRWDLAREPADGLAHHASIEAVPQRAELHVGGREQRLVDQRHDAQEEQRDDPGGQPGQRPAQVAQ